MGGAERNLLNLLRHENAQLFDALVITSQQKNKSEPFTILKTLFTGDNFSIFSAVIWTIITILIAFTRTLQRINQAKEKNWHPKIIHGYMTLPSGLTAVLLGKLYRIDPYGQPGVEAGKKITKKILSS